MAENKQTPRAILRRAPKRDCANNDGSPLIAYVAESDFEPIVSCGDHVWCSDGPGCDPLALPRSSFVVQFRGEVSPRVAHLAVERGIPTGMEISAADAGRIKWVKRIRWVEYEAAVEDAIEARRRTGGGHG